MRKIGLYQIPLTAFDPIYEAKINEVWWMYDRVRCQKTYLRLLYLLYTFEYVGT